VYRQWDQLFADICTAGLVQQKLTIADALSLFNDTASVTSFRVKPARIVIADISETGGMSFDAAWVCGLNDAALPIPVTLNPLLPYSLQRERGLPYATYEDCRFRADLQFAQLSGLANETRFSFYKNDEHTSYRASSYMADLALADATQVYTPPAATVSRPALEIYHDDVGISLAQKKAIGGSYLLKSQAQCPFKAYAEKRLGVEPVDARDHGLDSAERGNLVHRLLHGLWQSLKSRSALMTLTEEELNALICREVDNVTASLSPTQKLFVEVEARRLQRLALDWLNQEKNRTQDFTVISLELPLTFSCEGLVFDLKVDRIDELENGTLLILDYKTGNSSKSLWLDSRLKDPQMPVYYFAHENRVGALCFANTKGLNFNGVSESDVGIKGICVVETNNNGKLKNFESWDQLDRHWKQCINTLVNEVKDGFASVTPESPGICNFCGRQSLCRINQHQATPGQDDD
jgi:probable DNA repair protein